MYEQKSQRSRVEMFRKDFITLARSVAAVMRQAEYRVRIAKYFLNYLRENGIKLRDTRQYQYEAFSGNLLSRKAQGISHRTIQNERAVMRAILQKDGRYKLAAPDNPLRVMRRSA
ncbi:phage integrase N-terminal domain-containing protein [Escherichia coli]